MIMTYSEDPCVTTYQFLVHCYCHSWSLLTMVATISLFCVTSKLSLPSSCPCRSCIRKIIVTRGQILMRQLLALCCCCRCRRRRYLYWSSLLPQIYFHALSVMTKWIDKTIRHRITHEAMKCSLMGNVTKLHGLPCMVEQCRYDRTAWSWIQASVQYNSLENDKGNRPQPQTYFSKASMTNYRWSSSSW
jgi:hypothetical protein